MAITRFNRIAEHRGFEKVDLNQVRVNIGAEPDEMVSSWTELARLKAIAAFGDWNGWRTELSRIRRDRAGFAGENSGAGTPALA